MKPSFTEKYATLLLVGTAVVLAAMLFTVERFEMLPLQGAATPMYGSMPLRTVKKAVIRKASQTSSRRAARAAASSKRAGY